MYSKIKRGYAKGPDLVEAAIRALQTAGPITMIMDTPIPKWTQYTHEKSLSGRRSNNMARK